MMQIFAGLPLASELDLADLAVTAFRDQGRWQANLQHLPGNPGSNNAVPGVCADPLAIDDSCAEAPAADVNPAVNANISDAFAPAPMSQARECRLWNTPSLPCV